MMKFRGLSQGTPVNTAMADAIKRAGVQVRRPRSKGWPRLKKYQAKATRAEGGIANLHFAVNA